MPENTLYYGDNLEILKAYLSDESVDLVYLDPPFKSNQDYNVLFAEQDGSRSAAQIKAFEDTWRWDQAAAAAFEEIVERGGRVSQVMLAFRGFLGGNDVLAYLAMMAPRLVELRRVMKPTASIYLHCDPTASHYLKLLMDAVFEPKNFRNEIVWCYAGGGIPKKDFPRKHDVIFRYSKSDQCFFAPVYRPYSPGTVQRGRTAVKGKYAESGLRKEGTPVNDWWPDVPKITSPTDPEKLGYPTQKSEALLERIVQASSKEGDAVLDPFCGCGTAIAVAQRLNRQWIGIDITHLAVGLIKHRLFDVFGLIEGRDYIVHGEPEDLAGARQLAHDDPFQFQAWALGLLGARSADQKKSRDRGIDGRLYFHDQPTGGKTKQVIFSVKSGHITVEHIRGLRGVVEREKAEIGVFLTLEEPTREMRREVATAGFYVSPWGKHPRLQILTIGEILEGQVIDFPPMSQVNRTFKKAHKPRRRPPRNLELELQE
ncbi:MAG: DNA methyltransferase [Nitrospinota bacterium]